MYIYLAKLLHLLAEPNVKNITHMTNELYMTNWSKQFHLNITSISLLATQGDIK